MQKPIPNKPLRWGIIGCGNVTETKSGPAYQKTPGFQLSAVMRRDAEKLADYARRHNIPKTCTDAQALIDDPEIDAIYIATPPDAHKEYGLRVAAAGKPCCIEKPLAPCYADSKAIVEAFATANVPLFVAYYRRTLPRFEQIKTWLQEGAIGEVRHLNWQFCRPPSATDLAREDNWRTDAKVAPGGYFDDLASHGLDLFTHYLGNITDVHGFAVNQQGLYGAKDALSATWLHASGATGAASWNFGSWQSMDRVEIFGSSGTIEFSVFADGPVKLTTDDRQAALNIDHPPHVQLPHVESMARHLFEAEFEHPSLGASALHTSWVMDQILDQVAKLT
ncbi:Gfo/Idh/MocA family protein [Neolewinella antarctica]|uniref:Dehydrogenase n=1 Tax=Neolewinella antarctica TaxID=442734 RepID=A0ABX0XED1_9BACT|nr:Gfo/Idh/MocA family oxidoreductase [Neolewinella antarctica]NJC27645.1 putative dehydrogenase [Neolewinella antarctica]